MPTSNQAGALDQRLTSTQPSGALKARMAPGTLESNRAELAEAKGTDKQGFLGAITSLPSLLKLAGAGALALGGNEQAGLSLATGALQRADADTQQINAERQDRIDKLTAMIDKQQQRLTTLAVSQPGLFVDENGENLVQPGEWEQLLALNVPINPAAMMANAKEGKNDIKQYEVAKTLISVGMQASNPESVQAGLNIVNKVGGLGWTNDYINQLSYTDPSNIVRTLLDANEPASVMAALSWASENGASILSPGALRLLSGKTGDDRWKINSIDDQIKIDAYNSLKWFNEIWMNEKTDGTPNRLLYKANPVDSLGIAFGDKPDELIKLKKIFPATGEGDEIDRVKLTSLMQAAAMLPQMQLYMGGALTGTPEQQASALFEMGQSVDQMAAAGMGVARLNNLTGAIPLLGARYTQARKMDVSVSTANVIGADLMSIAHMLARGDGVDYASAPFNVRQDYDTKAMARYDALNAEVQEQEQEQ